MGRRPDAIVGVLARDRGALVPARQVVLGEIVARASRVDRRRAAPAVGSARPRRASLRSMRRRGCSAPARRVEPAHAGDDERLRLERQSIVLTVPASFDEEARELTVEAAREAGLAQLTLLEEPIAAFYAWMAATAAAGRAR